MPETINKKGYWRDDILDQFMNMMEIVNGRGNATAFVETPGIQMNSKNPNAYGPNGIARPGAELLPDHDVTRLILGLK